MSRYIIILTTLLFTFIGSTASAQNITQPTNTTATQLSKTVVIKCNTKLFKKERRNMYKSALAAQAAIPKDKKTYTRNDRAKIDKHLAQAKQSATMLLQCFKSTTLGATNDAQKQITLAKSLATSRFPAVAYSLAKRRTTKKRRKKARESGRSTPMQRWQKAWGTGTRHTSNLVSLSKKITKIGSIKQIK